MKVVMKRTIVMLCCLLELSIISSVQSHMRIYYKGGAVRDVPVEELPCSRMFLVTIEDTIGMSRI